ncbi:hypothetical protein [Streptomyces sp. PSAA01]|nr:hypothetical protein [Streptomyces sp. PSAA01]
MAGDAVEYHLAADARCRPLAFVLTAIYLAGLHIAGIFLWSAR